MTTGQFGPDDHSGLAVLTVEECVARLSAARVGRLAFNLDGGPTILPVNHEMDGHSVVFRTDSGSKLLVAVDQQAVAFEVDGYDPDRRSGWSVVIRGIATVIDDPVQIDRLGALGVGPGPTWSNDRSSSGSGRTR